MVKETRATRIFRDFQDGTVNLLVIANIYWRPFGEISKSCQGCPQVSPGWVCAQPVTDLMTYGCQKENPPLIEKTHRSSQMGLNWLAIGSVEADKDAARGSNWQRSAFFH